MIDLTQLTPDSTLGHLPSHHFQVSHATPGHFVAQKFAEKSELPGVLIMKGSRIAGMISRRKFNEWMSQPDRSEVCLKRPIQTLLDAVKTQPLQLPDTCKIDEAATIALNRSEDLVYEPVVIASESGSVRLLDMHVLLLAQVKIAKFYKQMIKMQKIEAHGYRTELQKEKGKVKSYTQLLEFNLLEIQKQNQRIAQLKLQLLNQAQEIGHLNQRFIQMGQLLSVEGRKAFQATFSGVSAICRNTDQIVDMGKALAKDLENVNAASRLISRVSQQVRYLAVQASVVANRIGGPLNEFSHVISEIGKLVSQTFEAGRRMDQLANRFKLHVQELTDSAREGAAVARGLIQKIERAEVALAELEELVKNQNLNSASVSQEDVESVNIPEAQSLIEKIEQVEGALTDLEEVVKHQDLRGLIEKIEQVLSRSKERILQ
ncbi:MAG: chemotaxis protein [Oscillatoria princeps RMCB-10]|jgi:methyl-accepting chemotaxis protein|nr:chemotaxis protein [Oscillatoria princeps RMCB-10]